jgi:uncharacterized protein YjiS (DUF1127 family)
LIRAHIGLFETCGPGPPIAGRGAFDVPSWSRQHKAIDPPPTNDSSHVMTTPYAKTASAARVAEFLRTYWNAFQERREHARGRAILYRMHERGLKDLGLTRSKIGSAMEDTSGERIRAHRKPAPLGR